MEKKTKFLSSARRHKIGIAHAMYVIENYESVQIDGTDSGEVKLYWRGIDDRGLELEVIGIEQPDLLLIIHVMPLSFRRRERNGY